MVLRNLHSLFASPVEKRHPGMAFPQAIVSCLDGQKRSHMTEKDVTFLGEFELLLSQKVGKNRQSILAQRQTLDSICLRIGEGGPFERVERAPCRHPHPAPEAKGRRFTRATSNGGHSRMQCARKPTRMKPKGKPWCGCTAEKTTRRWTEMRVFP